MPLFLFSWGNCFVFLGHMNLYPEHSVWVPEWNNRRMLRSSQRFTHEGIVSAMMQTTLRLGIRNVFEANDLKLKFPNNYMGDLFPHFCQAQPSSGESNPWIFLNVVEGRNQCLPLLCNFCLKLDKYGSHPCKHVHHCTSRCLENWFLATEFCVFGGLEAHGCASQEVPK